MKVGGRGRFVYQQRALLAVASTFAYMPTWMKNKKEHNKGRKPLNNAEGRVSVGVPGHYPFVCIVNWMHMHCQWHLEDLASVVIPTRTKEEANQRETSEKFNSLAFSRRHWCFRRFCHVKAMSLNSDVRKESWGQLQLRENPIPPDFLSWRTVCNLPSWTKPHSQTQQSPVNTGSVERKWAKKYWQHWWCQRSSERLKSLWSNRLGKGEERLL